MSIDVTGDQSWSHDGKARTAGKPRRGIVTLFTRGKAAFAIHPLGDKAVVLGRDAECDIPLDDHRASRRHVEVSLDGERWSIRDLASRNGTYVDGDARRTEWPVAQPGVLSVGDTICLLHPDVRSLSGAGVEIAGNVVLGPQLSPVWRVIERAAQANDTIHLSGETGTGKELAARHFHDAGPRRKGPFIAVNCAAIPATLAERLLFGARRGAYSGADADTEGYLTSAHKGTLFLDEVGELPPEVQAKLLRAVETREVLPLGASHVRPVDIALCSASHGELRDRIADGGFRDDLFFRLCQNEVVLPPLRARLEEASWVVEAVLSREGWAPHASLIEAVLRRSWPGNLRELTHATVAAARAAAAAAAAASASASASDHSDDAATTTRLVRAEHLAESAGGGLPSAGASTIDTGPSDETVLSALRREQGNVVRAARALGLHRNQLRRWLARHNIDPKSFAAR